MDLIDSSARLALLSDLIGAADDQGRTEISEWLAGTLRAHRESVAQLLTEAAIQIAIVPATVPPNAYERRWMASAFGRAKSVLGMVNERHGTT